MHINSARVNLAAAALAAALFVIPVFAAAPPLKPVHLLCDSLDRPLGIDSTQPLLSWQLQDAGFGARQTAYRIEVASTPTLLSGDKPDVWDSGRIASDKSFGVVYGGPELGGIEKVLLAGGGLGQGRKALPGKRRELVGNGITEGEMDGRVDRL